MLTWSAINAALHYAGIMGLGAALSVEIILLKGEINKLTLRRLANADLMYGITALLVLITGVLRVVWFDKGADYYLYNWLFLLKVTIFIVVGLWSLIPTLRFIRWRNHANATGALPSAEEIAGMRKIVFAEVHLLAILPFLAAFMARGFGFFGS